MKPLRIGGHRVLCPICKRKYATAPVFRIVCCGACLRALFTGYMLGQNHAWEEIHKKYDIKKKEGN